MTQNSYSINFDYYYNESTSTSTNNKVISEKIIKEFENTPYIFELIQKYNYINSKKVKSTDVLVDTKKS